MLTPIISVVIPTFRPDKYLIDCINSIYRIDQLDLIEVIIVLNGDRDPYYNFISSNFSHLKNVRIFYNPIKGVSSARNMGIDKSKSDFILFIDDDDFISGGFINEMIQFSKTGNLSKTIVAANFKTYQSDTGEIGDDYVTNAYNRCKSIEEFNIIKFRGFLSSVCGKLIHKDLIGKKRFDVNMHISEDGLFLFSISNKIENILLASDAIYYRRLREGSAIRSKKSFFNKTILWVKSVLNYSKVFLNSPLEYNFRFYITRLLAVTKVYLFSIFKK